MSKVLLVDKDTTRVTSIRQALERGGFETVAAEDGNEALKTFLNEVPDLVMVGPLAAEPDETFCHRMRETRPGTTIPIFFYCEAMGPAALKAALERSGCNVYVEMPASDERLVEVCRHALLESVEHGSGETPEASSSAATPAFASPGAALAELNTSGSDIDAHLEALFEMGDEPVASGEPAPSLDAAITDLPLGPTVSEPDPVPAAAMAEEVNTVDVEAPESPDSGRDLVGFQPDAVAFESEGEVDPGIQPEIASEAESLIQSPYGSPAPEMDEQAGFGSTDVTADVSSAGSLELDIDEAPAAEGAPYGDMQAAAPPAARTSRGWLWGMVAVAAVIGGIAMFFVLRPSPASDSGSENLASMRPAAPAPRMPEAVDHGTDVVDVDPIVEETPDAASTVNEAAAEATASLAANPEDTPREPDSSMTEAVAAVVVVTEEPADVVETSSPVASEPAAVASEPAAAVSEPAAVAEATPPDEIPVAPSPTPPANAVFQPSTEIVDPATAGEGFTAPMVIERVAPTYSPDDVLDGGENVVLRVLVNDWGKAVRVDIEQGRAGSPLVDAAIDAVLNTRYHAAELRGRQVRAWTTETFEFE